MTVQVVVKGPLFSPGASATVKAEAEAVIKELVEDGTKHLAEMLQPRPAGVYLSVAEAQKGHASTGNYRRNITPVLSGLNGRIHDNNVVYGPWLEGVGSRNETTRFRGYAAYRKTGDWLQERAGAVTKKHADELARKLNG